MTEEELREEATSTVEWESVPMIDRPLFVYAYVKGAEPREKRIEELEAQIEKMRCCYNCKQSQDESYCKIKKSDVNDLSCWDCGCDKWEIKEK